MRVKFVMLPPAGKRQHQWAARLSAAVPEADVSVCTTRQAARHALQEARAAYGTLDRELLAAASRLEWLACPAAGPDPSFFFPELVASPVTVTNARGIYSDHMSTHVMAFVLAFARSFHHFLPAQCAGRWPSAAGAPAPVHLPEAVALIVGTGGIGSHTARHCKHFGMRVIGVDPRCPEPPEGVDELHRPEALDELLGQADFVIVTVPQTPRTTGMFGAARLARMKPTGVLINVGRGTTVNLRDLDEALRSGRIGGAALDVLAEEPLPAGHPLWTAPNFLMTPHCAGVGPYLNERRLQLLIDNCQRLVRGERLLNVVDKEQWY
ncbi:MAG: D-2-hydroxyacid dehydrogenase [Candidatus Latescibacterota bacterium]